MDFSLGSDVEAFRQEARALFAPHTEFKDGFYQFCGDDHEIVREMGRRGMLDVTAEGGLEWDMKMYVLSEEAERMDIPLHAVAQTFMVGFTLSRTGNEEQRARVLPRIADGSLRIALGYSEPGAGSDIAGTKTRARRDGDEWVIDGQKQWISGADVSGYIWLLTRTDPAAKKHHGLTMFLCPTDTPGITIVPIDLIGDTPGQGGAHTFQVFFDGVRLPDTCRIGEANQGWQVLAAALVYEHGGGNVPGRSLTGILARLLDLGLAFVTEAAADGDVDDDVLEKLAEIAIDLELTRLLNCRATWFGATADKADIPGSVLKLVGRQAAVLAAEKLLDIVGTVGLICEQAGAPGNPIAGAIQQQFRFSPIGTVAGGSVEIQKTKLAERGLGLPRPVRA